ncbi:SDR family oxidoreductase [Flavobacterium sp. HSC-61S13]|uniref:SDR family oxidoreductase n=1 Tax=Flavobacterium sp. HSC-61S13 TaxID=2910963 RepID=UPI0020A1B557|nr:SDR family oxidoreductase [Flavobacterium sp. HSC-61S13]MCP1994656.1 NADP-dependent 3-hydroxy acid dehydrogenase YdfG [Flavobacterium sp. HSC-61S13]
MTASNKVVYITGGTKGIGFGVAKALVDSGYRVAISGRNLDDAQTAALSIGGEDQIIGLRSDVRVALDDMEAVQTIVQHFGQLDVVIANAGLGKFAPVDELSIEDWNAMIDTNLTGVFYTLKAGLPELIKNKGYFMSIASLAGINFFAGGSGYNASKFGVVGFTQAAMLDLRDKDVKVTVILPGSVTSHFNGHVPNEEDSWKIQPEDVGQLVVDLLKMNRNVLPSKIEIRPTKTK